VTNPLVEKQPESNDGFITQGSGDAGWASGIGIAESVNDVSSLNEGSSWVESGLAYGGLAMEGISLAVDPIGTLLSYGLSWLIEHVQPLKEALDWFAGDPDGVAAYGKTWENVSKAVEQAASQYKDAVKADTESWTGAAGDAYRKTAAEKGEALDGAAKLAGTISSVVTIMGEVVSFVREFVRDLVADCISRLITYALEALLPPIASLAWVIPQAIAFISKTVTKIADIVGKLTRTISNVSPKLAKLAEVFGDIMKTLGDKGKAGAGAIGKVAEKLDVAEHLAKKTWQKVDDTFGTDVVGKHNAKFGGGPDAPSSGDSDGGDGGGSSSDSRSTQGDSSESGSQLGSSSDSAGSNSDGSGSGRTDSSSNSSGSTDTSTSSTHESSAVESSGSRSNERDPSSDASSRDGSSSDSGAGGRDSGSQSSPQESSSNTTRESSSSDSSPNTREPGSPDSTPRSDSPDVRSSDTSGGTRAEADAPSTPRSGTPNESGPSATQGSAGTHSTDTSSRPASTSSAYADAPARAPEAPTATPNTPATRPEQPNTAGSPAGASAPHAASPNTTSAPRSGAPHTGSPTGWTGTRGTPGSARNPLNGEGPAPVRRPTTPASHVERTQSWDAGPRQTPPSNSTPPQKPDDGYSTADSMARERELQDPYQHRWNGPTTKRPEISDGLREKLGDHYASIKPSAAGLNMIPRGGPFGTPANRIPQAHVDPNRFTVEVHGSPNGVRVGNKDLDAKELAEIIRGSAGYRDGAPVRLVACQTGADMPDGSKNFAQQLSEELGVEVLAPSTDSWVDNYGNVYASESRAEFGPNESGALEPKFDSPGQWNSFRPDGSKATHDLPTPPGHYPNWARDGVLADPAHRRGIEQPGHGNGAPPQHPQQPWQGHHQPGPQHPHQGPSQQGYQQPSTQPAYHQGSPQHGYGQPAPQRSFGQSAPQHGYPQPAHQQNPTHQGYQQPPWQQSPQQQGYGPPTPQQGHHPQPAPQQWQPNQRPVAAQGPNQPPHAGHQRPPQYPAPNPQSGWHQPARPATSHPQQGFPQNPHNAPQQSVQRPVQQPQQPPQRPVQPGPAPSMPHQGQRPQQQVAPAHRSQPDTGRPVSQPAQAPRSTPPQQSHAGQPRPHQSQGTQSHSGPGAPAQPPTTPPRTQTTPGPQPEPRPETPQPRIQTPDPAPHSKPEPVQSPSPDMSHDTQSVHAAEPPSATRSLADFDPASPDTRTARETPSADEGHREAVFNDFAPSRPDPGPTLDAPTDTSWRSDFDPDPPKENSPEPVDSTNGSDSSGTRDSDQLQSSTKLSSREAWESLGISPTHTERHHSSDGTPDTAPDSRPKSLADFDEPGDLDGAEKPSKIQDMLVGSGQQADGPGTGTPGLDTHVPDPLVRDPHPNDFTDQYEASPEKPNPLDAVGEQSTSFRATDEDREVYRERIEKSRLRDMTFAEAVADVRAKYPEMDHLPDVEAVGLRRYVGEDAITMNRALRNLDDVDLPYLAEEIKILRSALNQMPDYSGPTAYRNIGVEPGELDALLERYKPGETVVENGFTSASKDAPLDEFGNAKGKQRVQFIIDEPRSAKDLEFMNPGEREILWPDGNRFEVSKQYFDPESGEWKIHLIDRGRE
jgi:hypothetical protein